MMGTRTGFHARRNPLIPLALLLPLSTLAARAAEVPPPEALRAHTPEPLEELDEVLVSGEKPSRKPSEIIAWMRRLVGHFNFEGHIDLGGRGNLGDQQPVNGTGECVPFGGAPAVQCEIKVSWPEVRAESGEPLPGGVSTLNPAIILFGFEPDYVGVRYMLVDSKGVAEPALGMVVGDTLVSREPCVNRLGHCQRVTRITAEPNLKFIDMRIDIEVDYQRVLAYRFLLRRVSAAPMDMSETAQ